MLLQNEDVLNLIDSDEELSSGDERLENLAK
jgi:hypothetical protein